MKSNIPWPAAVAAVVGLIAVAAFFMFRATGPAPGPDPAEAMKHIGPESIREAKAAGPPPGPPEPTLPRRPSH